MSDFRQQKSEGERRGKLGKIPLQAITGFMVPDGHINNRIVVTLLIKPSQQQINFQAALKPINALPQWKPNI